jgi:hypothetical protein
MLKKEAERPLVKRKCVIIREVRSFLTECVYTWWFSSLCFIYFRKHLSTGALAGTAQRRNHSRRPDTGPGRTDDLAARPKGGLYFSNILNSYTAAGAT